MRDIRDVIAESKAQAQLKRMREKSEREAIKKAHRKQPPKPKIAAKQQSKAKKRNQTTLKYTPQQSPACYPFG